MSEIKDFTRADGDAGSGGVQDFTRPRNRLRFRIDSDEFEAAPAIPAGTLAQLGTRFETASTEEAVEKQVSGFLDALELVLLGDSFTTLHARAFDKGNPVEMDQLIDILYWLLEAYGLRPTQSSSPSSDGPQPPEPGTNSTAPAPDAALTLPPSPQADS